MCRMRGPERSRGSDTGKDGAQRAGFPWQLGFERLCQAEAGLGGPHAGHWRGQLEAVGTRGRLEGASTARRVSAHVPQTRSGGWSLPRPPSGPLRSLACGRAQRLLHPEGRRGLAAPRSVPVVEPPTPASGSSASGLHCSPGNSRHAGTARLMSGNTATR